MTPPNRSPRQYGSSYPEAAADVEALEARISELEDQNAVLEAEKAALEGYAALAAHELVTPLVIAESYASLVGDRLVGPEHESSRRDLASLSRSAARARVLVETLLHDARARGRKLKLQPVDLNGLVAEIVGSLAGEVEERQASVEVADLPVVAADEPLLNAVFTNLIVNALKYGARQDGAIRITAQREPDTWRLLIYSGGPPISSEDRAAIFEPYNRARGERRERGVGLGLAICRRIVELHGGTIGVMPGDGAGNRFFFTLPDR